MAAINRWSDNSGKRSSGPFPFINLALAHYPDGRESFPIWIRRLVTHDGFPAGGRSHGEKR